MAIQDFSGQTFVAFLDISGFKELMKNDNEALAALSCLYSSGYEVLSEPNTVEGFFVSDSGILFVREGTNQEKLSKILAAVKSINLKMLNDGYLLTTSISFGTFDYHGKLEFQGIEKNPIYGSAYVKAFLDNEKGTPKIQPGQCRILKNNLPEEIDNTTNNFPMLKERLPDRTHLYFYWNVPTIESIVEFEANYNNSYKLKYDGMLNALRQHLE